MAEQRAQQPGVTSGTAVTATGARAPASAGMGIGDMGERIADSLKRGDLGFAIGLILMTVVFIRKAMEFNAFPVVLLIATLLRLALNLTTTRLILAHGHEGTAAAGERG